MLKTMKKIIENSKNHLDQVNEPYKVHAFFAMKTGSQLIKLGLMAFGHALLPSLWPSNVSDALLKMSQNIQARKCKDNSK